MKPKCGPNGFYESQTWKQSDTKAFWPINRVLYGPPGGGEVS